jgi:hypothetical protein
MKSLALSVLLLIFSVTVTYADGAGYSVDDDYFRVNKLLRAKGDSANVQFDSYTAVFEDYSTENVYYKWGTATSSTSFGNLSSSAQDASITVLEGGDGWYYVHAITGHRADFGAYITYSVLKNGASIDDIFREMTLGPERPLTFLNLSSTDNYTQDVIANTDSSTYTTRYANFTSTQKALGAVSAIDGIYYHVNEANVTPGFIIIAEASNIDIPQGIKLIAAYDGANHVVKLSVKRISTDAWVYLSDNGSDFYDTGSLPGTPGDYSERLFLFPLEDNGADFVDSSGKLFLQIKHESTGNVVHDYELDYASIIDRLNSIVVPNSHLEYLTAGDRITMSYKSSIPNTHFYRNNTMLELIRIGD